jgi:hypothetical protein
MKQEQRCDAMQNLLLQICTFGMHIVLCQGVPKIGTVKKDGTKV